MLTPYQFASNTPIQAIDLDGLEGYKIVDKQAKKTTMVVDIYYIPTTTVVGQPKTGFTTEEVEAIKAGIMTEFRVSKFVDVDNVDPISGAYDVDLQINLHQTNKDDQTATVNKNYSSPTRSAVFLRYLEMAEQLVQRGDKLGQLKGDASNGKVALAWINDNAKDKEKEKKEATHNAAHELFHLFTHVHQMATEALKNQISKTGDQGPGHEESGGIHSYKEFLPLNQKNITTALRTMYRQDYKQQEENAVKMLDKTPMKKF